MFLLDESIHFMKQSKVKDVRKVRPPVFLSMLLNLMRG